MKYYACYAPSLPFILFWIISKQINYSYCFFLLNNVLCLAVKGNPITMVLIIPLILFFFNDVEKKQFIKILIALFIATVSYLIMKDYALRGIINTKETAPVDNILPPRRTISPGRLLPSMS